MRVAQETVLQGTMAQGQVQYAYGRADEGIGSRYAGGGDGDVDRWGHTGDNDWKGKIH